MLMANRSDRRFRTLPTNHGPRGRLNDQQNEARGNPSWPGLSFTPTQKAGYTTATGFQSRLQFHPCMRAGSIYDSLYNPFFQVTAGILFGFWANRYVDRTGRL